MAKSGVSLPKCSQSPLTTSIQALCQQYNALAAAYNALTDEYNGTASRRNNWAASNRRASNATRSRQLPRVVGMRQGRIVAHDDHQPISRDSLALPRECRDRRVRAELIVIDVRCVST